MIPTSQVQLGDKTVSLPAPTKEVQDAKIGWLVVLDWIHLSQGEKGSNVIFFDKSGAEKWRISPTPPPASGTGPNPFAGCHFDSGKQAWIAIAVSGDQYFIDLDNGSLVFYQWSR